MTSGLAQKLYSRVAEYYADRMPALSVDLSKMDETCLYRQTKELLRNAGCRPRKRFGQNFLINDRVLDAIVEAAEISPEDLIVEIGAGTGALTQRLALSPGKVIAVELDEGLFRILQSEFQDKPNVNLVHADILDLDLKSLTAMGTGSENASARWHDGACRYEEIKRWHDGACRYERIKFLGNLPYYITTPILMRIIDVSPLLPVQMILVMVQREVGARMAASPGTKDYGALSIAVTYRSDVEILRRVSAGSFYPKPKVDSVLVKLNIKPAPTVSVKDEKFFFQIVRSAFQYRRKTLRNALLLASAAGQIQLSKTSVDSAFEALGLDPRRRGETLSKSEFADLADGLVSQLVY